MFCGIWQQLCDDIINGRFLQKSLGYIVAEYWTRIKEHQERGGNHGHGIAKLPGRSGGLTSCARSLWCTCSTAHSH